LLKQFLKEYRSTDLTGLLLSVLPSTQKFDAHDSGDDPYLAISCPFGIAAFRQEEYVTAAGTVS
jgi:hypothetical protein